MSSFLAPVVLDIHHLEEEAFGSGQLLPYLGRHALGHHMLVGDLNGEFDDLPDNSTLALHARTQCLLGHVDAVDGRISRQYPQGRRIARHLEIGILE